tara:strand:+ start:1339 stop:2274 length:936 start_codon:yes stop_codon:yes gene_type:complete
MRALISGVAGDIGFGIGRILKAWGVFDQLHGIDISDDHPGELLFDQCKIAPKAKEKIYLDWLSKYILEHKIDLFIPSSEDEINIISKSKLLNIENAKILINSSHLISTCLDKHETLSFLKQKGISVPNHGLVGADFPTDFPIIAKPRSGQGSRGLHVISKIEEYENCKEGAVWQEMLTPASEEYTCAVYVSPSGTHRNLLMKRQLAGGFTQKGEVVDDLEIESYVKSIAKALDFRGVINIQLRKTKSGPLIFEINPRLSSTLVFRDLMGFQDLRWWVADALGLPKTDYRKPSASTKFYRGISEYILKVSGD